MKLLGPINTGVAAGGAGVATNNRTTTTKIEGLLIGVYVKYNDSPPAGTTDILVKTVGTSPDAPTSCVLMEAFR